MLFRKNSYVGNFIKGTYQQMVKKRADYNHVAEALFNSESEINMDEILIICF